MVAHSKRNTSLAFFTSYERSLLKHAWGSQNSRLTRDSFLPFGSCSLCLLPAREPVACPNGDIFCRECAMNNLLSQRQEIKRLEGEMERARVEGVEKEGREDEEARERAVRDFEEVQMGLNVRKLGRSRADEEAESEVKKVGKRKFELDEGELLRIAQEERKKYKKELDDEKKAAATHLPSFWVPSQTPDSKTDKTANHEIIKVPKLHPLCPSSSETNTHNLTLKTLTTINFTLEPSPTSTEPIPSCPACKKALSNSSKAVLAIPCGHVLCKPCVAKFMTPVRTPDPHHPEVEHDVLRCYVCEADLTGEEAGITTKKGGKEKKKSKKDKEGLKPGLVELRSEGTGFAGGGGNVVKKEGVVFQC
ncbi:hypothetical protein EJ08DRAFT_646523 [Tothia fuscella]|uniref:RING-type domain-containing protein n=1 Tax=Tothia fuscella TaxID=1048955 RepID=A0A9P4P093_9PEZI|nr:hypothetical protein EJ08DRAFT_646523 [Tothia fuscella]